jgi:hypothetical protein
MAGSRAEVLEVLVQHPTPRCPSNPCGRWAEGSGYPTSLHEEEEHDANMKLPDDQLPVVGGQEEAASEPPIHSDW